MQHEESLILQAQGACAWQNKNASPVISGAAQFALWSESIEINPELASPIRLALRDIEKIADHDYIVELHLLNGDHVVISKLGYQYEDFVGHLFRLYHDIQINDRLLRESFIIQDIHGEMAFSAAGEGFGPFQPGEARLTETTLLLLPDKGEMRRFRLADLHALSDGDYTLRLDLEAGQQAMLRRFGSQHDYIQKSVTDAWHTLTKKAQKVLQTWLPDCDSATVAKLAELFRDGKAVSQCALEQRHAGVWPMLEQKIRQMPLAEEYAFLTTLAAPQNCAVGFKEGLWDRQDDMYVWFLMPIFAADCHVPGNAIALEAASVASEAGAENAEAGGKATYFFKIVSREQYKQGPLSDEDVLRQVYAVNRALCEINFRREPVYLPTAKLQLPQYRQYAYAVRSLPPLRDLRSRFIGRVVHSSAEQWQRDVQELLRFNVADATEDAIWTAKGGL